MSETRERGNFSRATTTDVQDRSELPVPGEAIAEDLLGLSVGESESLEVSGMLLPAERQVWLNGTEVVPRRRFTLAHEVGHWVCQCLERRTAPVYCRADEVGVERGERWSGRRTCSRAELLMPERALQITLCETRAIPSCAVSFGVSESAMHWRLFNLDLVESQP